MGTQPQKESREFPREIWTKIFDLITASEKADIFEKHLDDRDEEKALHFILMCSNVSLVSKASRSAYVHHPFWKEVEIHMFLLSIRDPYHKCFFLSQVLILKRIIRNNKVYTNEEEKKSRDKGRYMKHLLINGW